MSENKTCLLCNKIIRGRSDKKFCNDYCRNLFNNRNKPPLTANIKKTNKTLLINRAILESVLMNKNHMEVVDAEELDKKGFDFKFITAYETNKTGTKYYFCYEFGYFPIKGEKYLVFEKR